MAKSMWGSLQAQFRSHPKLGILLFFVFVVLPVLLILAGPWIVTETTLRQKFVSWVAPQFQRQLFDR